MYYPANEAQRPEFYSKFLGMLLFKDVCSNTLVRIPLYVSPVTYSGILFLYATAVGRNALW